MAIQSTGLSKYEKKRKRLRAADDDAQLTQLLFSRKQAAKILGDVSHAKLKDLEAKGILRPVRLDPHCPTGQVFYTGDNLQQIARGGDEGDADAE